MTSHALRHILYVEDDPDIREMVTFVLRDIGGFEVEVYANGADALAKAAESKAQLALLDVMMPGMDGPSLFAALKKIPETQSVPVVFMTAKICAAEVNAYKTLGAIGVIAKPFDTIALCDTIRTLWNSAQRTHAA
jgi:two-component system OmpR family response regulator